MQLKKEGGNMNPWKGGSYKGKSKNFSIGKERNRKELNNALIIGNLFV